MSFWRQTNPATWQYTTVIEGTQQLDADTLVELFNTEWQGAISNPATSVIDLDQYYTVQIDHDTFEVEAAVTFTRRYDHHDQLVEGIDT